MPRKCERGLEPATLTVCGQLAAGESPPWKGGVAAPIKKMLRSLLSGRRRGGGFNHRLSDVERLLLVSPYRAHIRSAHARPRLQRNGTVYLMGRPPLLTRRGEFACPSSSPRPLCSAHDLWVMVSLAKKEWPRQKRKLTSFLTCPTSSRSAATYGRHGIPSSNKNLV
jgi:hypothetical protein